MKRHVITMIILIALLSAILIFITMKSSPFAMLESKGKERLEETSIPTNTDQRKLTISRMPKLRLKHVTLSSVRYDVDPGAINQLPEDPPYMFRGGAGTGRVIDRQGNVIVESGEDIRIFGAAVSPDNEKILVKGGDAINFVVEPTKGKKSILPSIPPGANMLGLGDWNWMGPNKLFGSSGIQNLSKDGKPIRCCEGHNVARTKFYIFDLNTHQLYEVLMPETVTQPIVTAAKVLHDGHINLIHGEPHQGDAQDLGWFKIEDPK